MTRAFLITILAASAGAMTYGCSEDEKMAGGSDGGTGGSIVTGTGGHGGTAGGSGGSATGTGGSTTGTGGSATGTGGSTTGSGGTTGTGGSVATDAGTTGTGGTIPRDAGADVVINICGAGGRCRDLEAAYQQAVVVGSYCIPGTPNACTKKLPTSLMCKNAPCVRWVTTTAMADLLRTRWTAEGCTACEEPCTTTLACVAPTVAASSATSGLCPGATSASPPAGGPRTSPPSPVSPFCRAAP